jgi:hypothetical protein
MRLEVEQLVIDGFAISSSVNGYKIIRTQAELESAKKYLKQKAFSLMGRAEKLEANFQSVKLSKQISMF